MTLNEIRARKSAKVAEARAIVAAAETATRSLTTDEAGKFDAIKAEITDLEASETRAAFLSEQERSMHGEPVHGDHRGNLESRLSLVETLRAQMEGRSLTGAAAEMHAELERRHGAASHGGILVPLSLFENRANTTTTTGDLVGVDYRPDQFIGPLRNSLLIRALGVRTLSGLVGDVSIGKHGAGLSTGWVLEGGNLPESDMAFAGVTLTPKHVGGITEMSRQALQQTAPGIESLARDDLSYAIAAAVDAAIVAGTGLAGQPAGVIGRAGVQTADLPATWADVLDIEQQLRGANVGPTGWYTGTAVQTALRKILKSASAGSEYLATATTIGDLPAASSNAAPADTAILGDWSQVLVGQWGAVELLVNPYAEAPYRRGGVLIRAFSTVDIAVRHENAFVVATAP